VLKVINVTRKIIYSTHFYFIDAVKENVINEQLSDELPDLSFNNLEMSLQMEYPEEDRNPGAPEAPVSAEKPTSSSLSSACALDNECYMSPIPTRVVTKHDGGSDDDPVTPSIEDWKLSHATRSLIEQQRFRNKKDVSPEFSVEPLRSRIDAAPRPNARVDQQHEAPGGKITTSVSKQLDNAELAEDSAPASISDLHSNLSNDQSVRFTPDARKVDARTNSAAGDSPATPTWGGTPTKTCEIIMHAVRQNSSRKASVFDAPDSQKQEHLDGVFDEVTNSASLELSMNSDDGISHPAALSSPPRAVKILHPRRLDANAAPENNGGWIPLITESEWKTAPAFLQLQIDIKSLNTLLTLLNEFIAATMVAEGSKQRLESFSHDEIVKIAGGLIDPAKIKIATLGFVHLKRLDVGTENSIKVYRIRRFY
jgi:hypothetical protein